jgi:hypothetical protein
VLSYFAYGYGAATYSNAVDQGLIENETAFAAVGFALRLGIAAAGCAMALALLALAGGARGRRNKARVGAWIVGGLQLLGSGCASLPNSADAGITGAVSAYPTWFITVHWSIGVLTTISLLTALILLASPAANRFFQQARIP